MSRPRLTLAGRPSTTRLGKMGTRRLTEALIQAGADVNAVAHYGHQMPIHLAAWQNENPEVMEALIKGGADVEARNGGGDTALHLAVWLNPPVVEALLDGGADIRARTSSGRTPLDLAEDPFVVALLRARMQG